MSNFNPKWPRWPMWIAVACELVILSCLVRGASWVGMVACVVYGYFSATWALFAGAFGDEKP